MSSRWDDDPYYISPEEEAEMEEQEREEWRAEEEEAREEEEWVAWVARYPWRSWSIYWRITWWLKHTHLGARYRRWQWDRQARRDINDELPF